MSYEIKARAGYRVLVNSEQTRLGMDGGIEKMPHHVYLFAVQVSEGGCFKTIARMEGLRYSEMVAASHAIISSRDEMMADERARAEAEQIGFELGMG